MKKIWFFPLCFVLLVAALMPKAEAVSGMLGNLLYDFDEATGTLTISGQGPMEYRHPAAWYEQRENCTAIVVEEGVTTLANSAFVGFEKVTQVSLPSTLTAIDGSAFAHCRSLENIQIPGSVKIIGASAFLDCSSLKSLTVPQGVEQIENAAFCGCMRLTSVSLPDSLQLLGGNVFSLCWNLTSIVIPDSVISLGGSAFSGCGRLESITLSKNLTEMDGNVFQGCSALQSVVIPDKVTSIHINTFTDCESLTSVTIGAGVTEIDTTAFNRANNLKKFTLSSKNTAFFEDNGILYSADKKTLHLAPKGISGSYTVLPGTTALGERCFYECNGLTQLYLPDSVTQIGANAMELCESLETVQLGSKVEKLGAYAFSSTSIKRITLPASLKKVGKLAFSGCGQLQEVTFLGKKPEIADNAFLHVTANAYYPPTGDTWTKLGSYGGYLTWKMIDCQGKHKEVNIAATDPTCTTPGLTSGSYCGYCGLTLKQQEQIPAVCTFGGWETVLQATTQAEGKMQRICRFCGKTEEKTIPKLTAAEEDPTEPPSTDPSQPPTETTPETNPGTTPQDQPEKPKNSNVLWIVFGGVAAVVVLGEVISQIYRKKKAEKQNR